MVLFWWGGWYAVNVLYRHGVPPFPWRGYRSSLIYVRYVKELLKFDHAFILVGFWRHSLIVSLNVVICANRAITFDTITVS